MCIDRNGLVEPVNDSLREKKNDAYDRTRALDQCPRSKEYACVLQRKH